MRAKVQNQTNLPHIQDSEADPEKWKIIARQVKDQRKIRKYKQSLDLEDFSNEELEFLEKLSEYSMVNTNLQQLSEYNSVDSKKEFCQYHKKVLSPDEKYDFEMLTFNYNKREKYRQPIGYGLGFGIFTYYLITRPKTKKLNWDLVKSVLGGALGYAGYGYYNHHRYSTGISGYFDKIMDMKISKQMEMQYEGRKEAKEAILRGFEK